MRKAVQAGMWCVLAMASWMSSPAMAQEGPASALPGRVESDPRLEAASKAWHDAWRANVEAHLRTVAARGTPRDLLVAGWLWPVEGAAGRIVTDDAFFAPLARAWIQAAYERAHGDDALVDWTLLNACPATGADCDRAVLLQRLMAADPGNAEILLTAYEDAVRRNDTVAAERHWQAASAGTHYRPRINELGTLMVSELRKVPAPVLDPALATAMGEIVQLGRDATPRDMADLVVMARLAAIALPTLVPVRERCTAQAGSLPPAALSACRRIHGLLADDGTILISQMLGLPRLVEWAETDAGRDAARQRLLRFAWVYESQRSLGDSPEQKVPEDDIDHLFREGEFATLRLRLQINGIATEPPAGWLPDHPRWRALLTGAPMPAPR